MREFWMTLLGVSLLSGVVEMLLPQEGEGKKYVKLVGALCVLTLLINPLASLLRGLWNEDPENIEEIFSAPETQDYEAVFSEAVLKGEREEIERLLEENIQRECGIQEGALTVRTHWEDDALTVVWVEVGMDGITVEPHAVISYVENWLGCRCEFLYDI